MTYTLEDYPFQHDFEKLPEMFYQTIQAEHSPQPKLIVFNNQLAESFGLDHRNKASIVEILSGNRPAKHSSPIAMAYAGHQFGHYVPKLGDGRALLLGEMTNNIGKTYDLHLKGSGKTRYSRNGDGRAPLAACLREYIMSEAMHALGIPTTRSLAVIATGQDIHRQQGLVPGGILARIASSHLRIGSFEYAAQTTQGSHCKALADFAIKRHFPSLLKSEHPYQELLRSVCLQQAKLVAKWMQIGFIHGVMNTDNMAISGETFDYGPCALLEDFDYNKTFSSIDLNGRYAYGNQGNIAQWDLTCLAHAMLQLIDKDQHNAMHIAQNIIDGFNEQFQKFYWQGMHEKIGGDYLKNNQKPLILDLLSMMQKHHADYTLTFRILGDSLDSPHARKRLFALFHDADDFQQWYQRWHTNQDKEQMHLVNPIYVPRNHLVEQVIQQTIEGQNPKATLHFLEALSAPYTPKEGYDKYAQPARVDEIVCQTFCGT